MPTGGQFVPSKLSLAWRLAFVGMAIAAVLPILFVAHPPLQDLPQHLAAINVIRRYPDLALGQMFELQLLRTQYLGYYGAAWLLSFPFGVVLANKLLLSLALIALPWSIASLLGALGRDPRLAVFAFGLTYNAHLVLGFFNFIAAIPLLFWGLAHAVTLRNQPSRRGGFILAGLLLACFYMHVVPFGFLALGAMMVLTGDGVVPTLRRAWMFVPAAIATLIWLIGTPAGSATLAAAGGRESGKTPQFSSIAEAVRDLPMWLTDVLHGTRDDHLLIAWGTLWVTALAVGLRRRPDAPASEDEAFANGASTAVNDLTWRLGLLCPIAFAAYFVAPTSYDWIWPISARFPLLSLLFATLLLPSLRGALGSAILASVAFLALIGFYEVGRAFDSFDSNEVGDIEGAIEAIPAGERVAGLIFDRGSREVKFSPFLHFVALYQAEKGGAVMFTFADFPQSPFRFKPSARPPHVPPRWEWTPERIDPARDLSWYRYVLVRGGPGRIAKQSDRFENVHRSGHWSVWRQKE